MTSLRSIEELRGPAAPGSRNQICISNLSIIRFRALPRNPGFGGIRRCSIEKVVRVPCVTCWTGSTSGSAVRG